MGNNQFVPSIVQQPRAYVSLGGVSILVEECTVHQTKKNTASTFSAKAPLTAMTAAGCDLNYLGSQSEIQVTVSYDAGNGAASPLFTGTIDKVDVDLTEKGQYVSLSGRDQSKQLHDKKSNSKYANKKSEEVAQDLAGQAGLGLNTDSGTVITGRIYTAEQVKLTNNPSLWTALRHLGEAEGKVIAVFNGEVYFRTLDDQSLPPFSVFYSVASPNAPAQSSGIVKLKLGRNYNAAKKHTVNVKSWDHKKKQTISSTASSGSGDHEQVYNYYTLHHKTQDQVDKHAKSKLKEHTRHEFDCTVEMPGDTGVSPLNTLQLSGTNSPWDQTFNIDSVEHKMSLSGYMMTITTKAAKKGRNS